MNRARLSLGLMDQVLSSASNVLIVFAIARVSSVNDFGSVVLTIAALTTVMATCRGFLGTPIALSSSHPERIHDETTHAMAAAALVGLVGGMSLAIVGLLVGAPPATYVVALAMPIVLLQDVARYQCIAVGRPRLAVAADGLWAVGSLSLLAVTWFIRDWVSAPSLLAGWAGLGLVALLVISVPQGLRPRIKGFGGWWAYSFHDRLRFGAEAAIGATTSFVMLGSATAIIGVNAAAALRGAGTVLGPLSILMSAIPLAVVPELRRRRLLTSVELWVFLRKIAVAMSSAAVAVGVLSFFVPDGLGRAFLGESWSVVRPLLPITATEYAALAWLSAAAGGLRVQARSGPLLRIRLVFALLTLLAGSAAAVIWGQAVAVAWALALAAGVAAVVARAVFLRPRSACLLASAKRPQDAE